MVAGPLKLPQIQSPAPLNKQGYHFGNKGSSILGSILGYPYLGKLQFVSAQEICHDTKNRRSQEKKEKDNNMNGNEWG